MIELNQQVLPTFLRPAGVPGSRNKPIALSVRLELTDEAESLVVLTAADVADSMLAFNGATGCNSNNNNANTSIFSCHDEKTQLCV